MNSVNRKNLKILAKKLETVNPEHFDITVYNKTYESRFVKVKDIDFSCNTCGCVLGHAATFPEFKITEQDIYEFMNDYPFAWQKFTEKYFGIEVDSFVWTWLFSTDWSEVDNTLQGAIRRINYFIQNGMPENFIRDFDDLNQFVKLYNKPEYDNINN